MKNRFFTIVAAATVVLVVAAGYCEAG